VKAMPFIAAAITGHAKARMVSNVAAISRGARTLRRMNAAQAAAFSAANSGVSAWQKEPEAEWARKLGYTPNPKALPL